VFISLSMLIREEIGVRVRGGNENERAQIWVSGNWFESN
jgi:hypothetical protein